MSPNSVDQRIQSKIMSSNSVDQRIQSKLSHPIQLNKLNPVHRRNNETPTSGWTHSSNFLLCEW